MHLDRIWLLVMVLSVEILAFGEIEHSKEILFWGAFGFVLASVCETSSLFVQFVKKHRRS
jgi:hypothetical protein